MPNIEKSNRVRYTCTSLSALRYLVNKKLKKEKRAYILIWDKRPKLFKKKFKFEDEE